MQQVCGLDIFELTACGLECFELTALTAVIVRRTRKNDISYSKIPLCDTPIVLQLYTSPLHQSTTVASALTAVKIFATFFIPTTLTESPETRQL
jgi:hypothetical protein